jgi:hypothetical protein
LLLKENNIYVTRTLDKEKVFKTMFLALTDVKTRMAKVYKVSRTKGSTYPKANLNQTLNPLFTINAQC